MAEAEHASTCALRYDGIEYRGCTCKPLSALSQPQDESQMRAALMESNKFWRDLERGLVQAAERGMSKVDVGDLLTAVRHVLKVEDAALAVPVAQTPQEPSQESK